MESFWLAASVVIPLLVYMLVGIGIRKLRFLDEADFKKLNTMVFHIFLPLTLFFDVYEADLGDAVRPRVFAYVLAAILVVFALSWVVVSRYVRENADASVMIQGISRSNFVLFGSTVAASMCGACGRALVAALAAMVVPAFNILSILVFELKRGGSVNVSHVLWNIVKNPLVEAGVLGLVCSALGVRIPELLEKPLTTLGSVASPLALVILGGMLSFGSIVEHRAYLTAVVIGRLIVVPLSVLSVAVLAGMRGDALIAIVSIFASPTAVASAPMAQAMGGNGKLAAEIVAMTSAGCILTMFIFVFTLSGLGLI